MPRWRVMIAQFPYGDSTHPDVSDWVAETLRKCVTDPRIGEGNVALWRIADTPITMTRNACLKVAEDNKFDFVCMIDSDMSPDIAYEGAKPFWETTFDFMVNHDGPCVVAAPYCGPPPFENVYTFRFTNRESNQPNADFQIAAYTRDEAAELKGIQRAGALPTGLMLIDMRAIQKLKRTKLMPEQVLDQFAAGTLNREQALVHLKIQSGLFYYEWTDPTESAKASTEDVTFSRDLTYAGVPIYCNWDSWAGHWKRKRVGKPQPIPADVVPKWMLGRALELAKDNPIATIAEIMKPEPPMEGEFMKVPGAQPTKPASNGNGHTKRRRQTAL